MTFSAAQRGRVPVTIASTDSIYSIGSEYHHESPTFASAQWVAVGVAVFVPFWVPSASLVTRMWWQNGSAIAGNFDVGIYDLDGNRLTSSGNTAPTATSGIEDVEVADIVLARGTYYMAMSSDTAGATQTVNRSALAAIQAKTLGFLEATSANPLPSTVTLAAYTRAFWPIFGLQVDRGIGP